MPDPIVSPQVYELTEQWNVTWDYNGSMTGTRVFLETDADLDVSKVPLPIIGEFFDINYRNITLKNISVTLVSGSKDCGRKYVCSYDANPYLQGTGVLPLSELPIMSEVAGEVVSYVPDDGIWVWKSDGEDIKDLPFYYIASHNMLSITRVCSDFDVYNKLCESMVNQVNLLKFREYEKETVMFNGCNLTPFYNKTGKLRWKADLKFTTRIITKDPVPGNDGWNWIIRDSTGDFDKPHVTGNPAQFIYDLIDFTPLFTSDALVDEPIIIPDK